MRTWNKFLTAILISSLGSAVYAQTMPQIGNITAPKMPTLSSPTIGKGFYSPQINSPAFPEINVPGTDSLSRDNIQHKEETKKSSTKTDAFSLYTNLLNYEEQKSTGKLLRFVSENNDILSCIKNFSVNTVLESNSILISGTAKTDSSGNSLTENFYMMLTPDTSKNAFANYNVTFVLNQNNEDTGSPLYHLSEMQNLTAERTGNLIKIKTDSTDFLCDLGEY